MKSLQFRNNIRDFLFDLDEFITIYDNYFHVFNYNKLNKLSENKIVFNLNNKTVILTGNNLKIKQMTKQELLITGDILKVEFNYE
jgi:sporulation protein YqfC